MSDDSAVPDLLASEKPAAAGPERRPEATRPTRSVTGAPEQMVLVPDTNGESEVEQ